MAINISKTESNNLQCGYRGESTKSSHAKPSFGWEVKGPKKLRLIEKMSSNFTSADQRILMGLTALMTQPFFDIYNKRVDDDTRTVSCARTIGKILAGTATGVSIRWGCIEIMNKFCKNEATEAEKVQKAAKKGKTYEPKKLNTMDKCLLPSFKDELGKEVKLSLKEISKYKNAMGTLVATFIMVFTNFLIDAPLTTYFTNILTKKIRNTNGKEQNSTVQKGGR